MGRLGVGGAMGIGAGIGLAAAGGLTALAVTSETGDNARFELAKKLNGPGSMLAMIGIGVGVGSILHFTPLRAHAGVMGLGAAFGGAVLLGLKGFDHLANSGEYEQRTEHAKELIKNSEADYGTLGLEVGEPVDVKFTRLQPGAQYDPFIDQMRLGIDNESNTPHTSSQEVIDHEYGHRIIHHYAPGLLFGKPDGTVLHESIADTFAVVMSEDQDWIMGNDNGDPIGTRSLSDPASIEDPAGRVPPEHRKDKYGGDDASVESHLNAGIPNKAAFLIGSELGKETLGTIYAEAVRNGLNDVSNIAGWADLVATTTAGMYGVDSAEHTAVRSAWSQVGYETPGGLVAARQGNPKRVQSQDATRVPEVITDLM